MPFGATPTASQEAADGGASSRRRRRWAKWGKKKGYPKRKCDANSTSARRIFQRRQPVAFEHFAPRSETTDEKEFGGWKIPKASNNNRCAPGGRNWEIDGWRKKSTVFILELWCRTAPDTTCVQGNGPASRELSPIPTVPTSDRNKSSFDPWKRFRAAATNAAA